MLKQDLSREFKTREPWVTRFVIDGQEYGGQFDALNDKRVDLFFESFPHAQTILELGSLEGGHTFALAKRPTVKRIVAVEGRDANVNRAKFVQSVFGAESVEFEEANLEKTDLSSYGRFDAVYCVGLLYHLPRPWDLVERIARVSPNLFLWTHYVDTSEARERVDQYQGKWYAEHGFADPLSGLSPKSFWPTLDSLKRMLTTHGLRTIHVIENDPAHVHGPCVTLAASAG